MAAKRWEISSLQAGMLVAGSVSLTGHALAVTQFMRAGGRDAWLSGILAFPAAVVAVLSLTHLGRLFPGKTMAEYLPKILGYLGYPVALLYMALYFTTVVFTIRMTTDWLVDSLLPETPSWVMGLLYLAVVTYSTLGGLDALARINQFILPLLTALGLLVSFGTLQSKDYRLLLPIMEYGPGPIVAVTFLGLGYYGETSILGMFHAYITPRDRHKSLKAYIIALVFVVVTLTGPLAGSVATLGYRLAQNMAYPTFQHWLMISLARFFERTDLLAVHQWLAGAYVRCGIFLLLACRGVTQIVPLRIKPQYILVGAAAMVLAVSEMAFRTKPAFDLFVGSVYLPASAILGIFLPPLLVAVALVRGIGRSQTGVTTQGD